MILFSLEKLCLYPRQFNLRPANRIHSNTICLKSQYSSIKKGSYVDDNSLKKIKRQTQVIYPQQKNNSPLVKDLPNTKVLQYEHSYSHMQVPQIDTNSHSHKHSHQHMTSDPFLVFNLDQIKKNSNVRITWIGLLMNVGITLGKFVGGIVFHSQALLADSIHAASDIISDVLTLLSINMASRKPTKNFPYGYGKIDTVGSLAVSGILAMAGISIGWSSLVAIVGSTFPHTILETLNVYIGSGHGHSHSRTFSEGVTNINAAWIAGGSIIMKEWIFHATRKIAIQTNSIVLMANAWHHRVDSLTSAVALTAITSSYFFHVKSLDAIGGLLVSVLIIRASVKGIIISMKELIDHSISNKDERYIKINTVLEESLTNLSSKNNSEGLYKVKDLIVLSSGPNLHVNVVLETPLQKFGNITNIREMNYVSHYLRKNLKENITIKIPKIEIEYVEEESSKIRSEKMEDEIKLRSTTDEIHRKY